MAGLNLTEQDNISCLHDALRSTSDCPAKQKSLIDATSAAWWITLSSAGACCKLQWEYTV